MDARCRELEHPVDVRRRDKVPRRPQDVRTEEAAVVERALDLRVSRAIRHPQAQRPFGGGILLRLHRAEPRYKLRRLRRPWSRDALVVKSLGRDATLSHVTVVDPVRL